jgi:hypothetical protein
MWESDSPLDMQGDRSGSPVASGAIRLRFLAVAANTRASACVPAEFQSILDYAFTLPAVNSYTEWLS